MYMRIAVLAPLKRELSHDTKGGRPRIVYNLVQELSKRTGYEVTVFGTGDSDISAHLIPVIPKALFHLPAVENDFYRHLIYLGRMMEMLKSKAAEFDLIHNHLYPEILPLLFAGELKIPLLTTIHTQMTTELGDFFQEYRQSYYAPISDRQKELYPGLNYTDVVYNGIDEQEFGFSSTPTDYFLFVGRIREFFTDSDGNKIDPKGVTDAIRIAKKTGIKLKILGNVESQAFYQREIAPNLSDKIEFVGDPRSAEGSMSLIDRIRLYQGARGLLLPVHWEEPFGIVMIEAMSCGTPVIAYRKGAIPEVITSGVDGYIAQDEDDMVRLVTKIGDIDRMKCRQTVLSKFTTLKMTDGYIRIYEKLKNP